MHKLYKFGILTVIFSLVSITPAHAYIDPGTGSMLFSVVLGVVTTLFFLLNSLVIKLKMLLFSNKNLYKNNAPFVIYSEGKQYFNVFLPIIEEFEKRKVPLIYYTSSEDDPFFSYEYEFVKGEYIGQGFDAFMKLAFLKADICLMTTPQLDVLQLKRSKFVKHYSHIFHSVATSLTYRLFSLDYFDSVLCNGNFQIPMTREIEHKRNLPQKEMVVVGCTYLDVSAKKLKDINENNHKFTILLAPSWGESGILTKYGDKFIDKLAEGEWDIIIRPHPQSIKVEKDVIEKLQKRYSEKVNIIWDFDRENLPSLAKADILISDFSGIIFDYTFLFNRPVIYVNNEVNKEIYDFSDLDEEPWCYSEIRKIGTELTKENFENIIPMIQNLTNNEEVLKAIEKAKTDAWQYQGQSGKMVADFMIKKQKEISKC